MTRAAVLVSLTRIIVAFYSIASADQGSEWFPKYCGRCPKQKPKELCSLLQNRIVGGYEAKRGGFPWQVVLSSALPTLMVIINNIFSIKKGRNKQNIKLLYFRLYSRCF